MVLQRRKKKTPTVTHASGQPQAVVSLDPLRCCKDLDEWPQSWIGFPKDLPPGDKLVDCFRPFIHDLIQLQLSRKTVCRHVDNLWVLGGEIIRDLNEIPSPRKVP